ncbi:hypothetical protein R5R35_008554 [Gryllus longicercus]|uniref:Large ribosomal subunit protein uL13 n=1 Tax=Gryllus longicercus TaxID=2509291 RepID=A0AAN9VSU5_9ORTH
MTGLNSKAIIIDGKGHLLGRLAAVIAKSVLQGNRIVVVRCELLNISGNFFRAKLKYLSFLRKRCNVNPARGPFHFRAPSKILWRTVRGMLPHKTTRGKQALRRLKAYEGCPRPYDTRRRLCVPGAMRVLCLKPGRKYCRVGRLSHEVGWKYKDVVNSLERKRKLRTAFGKKRRASLRRITDRAGELVAPKIKKFEKIIESYGK